MSIFVNYEGIKGESSDSGHKDWIDAKSISWGVLRQITSNTSTKGDRESSNATISDITLFKYMDKASPKIFIETCCGTGKNVLIDMTKTGQGQGSDTYIRYKLYNALLSNYHVRYNQRKSSTRPIEVITISFAKLQMKYMPYDDDGLIVAPIATGFDYTNNMKL